MGESCGGVSATLLLHNKEPLFRRVNSMGGHPPLMAPIPFETANEAYAKVVDCLGLRDLSTKQRVEKLRTIPHKEIIDKVPGNIPNRPVIDGTIFKRALTAQKCRESHRYRQHSRQGLVPRLVDRWLSSRCKRSLTDLISSLFSSSMETFVLYEGCDD